MGLAHAPQDQLGGLDVALEPDRRLLGDDPLQPGRELVLVGLALRRDRDRQQRLGHVPGRDEQRVVLGREGVAGLGPGQLRDRARCRRRSPSRRRAGSCRAGWTARRPSRRRRGPRGRDRPGRGPRRAASRPGRKRAGEHPDQGDPPDVRVGGRLDDLGAQPAGRVAGQRLDRRAVRPGDRQQRVLERRREAVDEHFEHLGHAEAGAGAGREHGIEAAARDRGLEVVDQHLDVDVLAVEVAVHQRLVLGLRDDRLDQGVAVLGDQRQVLGVGIALDAAAARSSRRPAATAGRSGRRPPRRRRAAGDRAAARRHRTPSWQAARVASKSARGESSRVITTARGMPTVAHSSQIIRVVPSMPSAALTTNSAASAARRPARRSPVKSA